MSTIYYPHLLEINNLSVHFFTKNGIAKAVNGVEFYIDKGETLGIVGESGCGKSVSSLAIMRLLPKPYSKIVNGEILFKGNNLLKVSERKMQKIRGNEISMIFQEPMTSLNPSYTIGRQISEVFTFHQGLSKKRAIEETIKILSLVGIPEANRRVKEYPHEMSGGMRQRVMIAMALSCAPDLLIADEPTTALDVTIQAQILNLMYELQNKFNMAVIIITHNLGVVAEISQRVIVVYAGQVVEHGKAYDIFDDPKHPYTIGLLESTPRLDETERKRLKTIDGLVPNSINLPEGCKFNPRCRSRTSICERKEPIFFKIGPDNSHYAKCWLHEN
jgi:oligopeptide/dipeptide ABC transporter ATP-binding protein